MANVSAFFSHQTARDGLLLTAGALAPPILRSVGDWTLGYVIRKCCKMSPKELAKHLIGKGEANHDALMDTVMDKQTTWTKAKDDLGINHCTALFISAARLLLWHCMQPLLYWYVLYAYWDLLHYGQHVLGMLVGFRESIYFTMVIMCSFSNPAFLLVDVRASCRQQAPLVAVYVLAPEKFIFLCLPFCGRDLVKGIGLIILGLLDVIGVVAFVWAFAVHNVYIPMMVGYAITTIGGFFVLLVMCAGCCMVGCSCCCNLQKFAHLSGATRLNSVTYVS